MGDWQVSAAKWLTHWLDALGALDPNSKSPSVAHFDQFAEVLRDYLADCRTTDESALTSGVRGLLSALRGQLGTARELQRSLALQFEALLGTALPSFETWPAEGERWQQLIARVAVYQAELRALGNLHFDLIDHALAHI